MKTHIKKESNKQVCLFGSLLMFLFTTSPSMAGDLLDSKSVVNKSVKSNLPEIKGSGIVEVSQQRDKVTIAGVVTDNLGPIAGVNIVEKGTTNGIITDVDGKYTLTVVKGATLQISYIGFVTQEIVVGDETTINVRLVEDTQKLDEVVVVGYGVQKKEDVTGARANASKFCVHA